MNLLRAFFIAVVFVGASVDAEATTVVAIRTRTEVVIAADSMASGGADFRVEEAVCKIRVHGNTVVATAGFMSSPPLGISIESLVRETFSSERCVRENVDQFTRRFIPAMEQVIRWAQKHSAQDWSEYQRAECFQALFAGFEHGEAILLHRTFACLADFQGRAYVIPARRADCPGDCIRDGLRYVALGESEELTVLAKPESFWKEHQDRTAAARLLVAAEVRGKPDRVGPPINIVRITENGVECADCSDLCQAEVERGRSAKVP